MTTITKIYYNGTVFPMVMENPDFNEKDMYMTNAKEMIALGLRKGVSIPQQIKDYKETLDRIEDALCKFCNPSSKKGLDIVAEMFSRSPDRLRTIWCLNVSALLIMKAIEDDNNNGFLIEHRKGKTVVFVL